MTQYVQTTIAAIVLASVCGCSSDSSVSKADEENFRHPHQADMSKLPPDAFKPKGPAFIGAPSGATRPGAKPPPTTAVGN
jgi:hypothetical protein